MSGAASPTTGRPMTRGRVRQDLTAPAARDPALLPELNNHTTVQPAISPPVHAQDAAGATAAARPMPVAISAAEEAQLHDASEALHREISRVEDDDSRTQAAPQAAEPMPPARTAATVRAGLIAAGMRADSTQDQALLDAVVATILPAVPAPDATEPPHGYGQDSQPPPVGQRSLRSTFGLPPPTPLRPTGSAYLRTAAVPTLRRPSLQRPSPLPGHFPRLDDSTQFRFPQHAFRTDAMPHTSLAPTQPVNGAPPCGACGLWHESAECPAQLTLQAPQLAVVDFGRSSFGMRARKPSSFSGKPDENVTHWVRAMEKHLRVA